MTIQRLRPDRAARLRRRRPSIIYIVMMVVGFGAALLIATCR
jgi:hypothetical protein